MWALLATGMSVRVHGFSESSVAGMQGRQFTGAALGGEAMERTMVKSTPSHIMMVLPVI